MDAKGSACLLLLLTLSIVTEIVDSNGGAPSSYSNLVHGSFKDDFFLNNVILANVIKSERFGNGKHSGRNWLPWFFGSFRKPNAKSGEQDTEGEKPHFSYDNNEPYGPDRWGQLSSNCDGNYQSPVNLVERNARDAGGYHPLIIDKFYDIASSVNVSNNGHSAVMSFDYPNKKPARFLGGPLRVPYIVDNIHWHWGAIDTAGSEHFLNYRQYSAEVHLVSYNSNYGSISEAAEKPKGLAVLSFFYEVDHRSNAYNPFIPLISKVTEPESVYQEFHDVLSLKDIIKTNKFRLLSYKGSLTTPNCLETVTWMVSTTPIKISSADLAEFRKLKDAESRPLTNNFRPLQPLNYRKILAY